MFDHFHAHHQHHRFPFWFKLTGLFCALSLLALIALSASLSVGMASVKSAQAPGQPAQARPEEALALRQPLERKLAGGEAHRFSLALNAGQFARVVVTQQGVDVVARLLNGQGRLLAEVDRPNGKYGSEELVWLTEGAVTFTLEIRALEQKAAEGRYSVQWAENRAARPEDQQRIAAQMAVAEGNGLRAAGKEAEHRQAAARFESAATTFQSLGDTENEGYARTVLGWTWAELGEKAKAQEALQTALAIWERLKHRQGEAIVAQSFGDAAANTNDWPVAMKWYERAYGASLAGKDPSVAEHVRGRILNHCIKQGDRAGILRCTGQLGGLQRRAGDVEGAANTFTGLGRLAQQSGELKEALFFFEQSLLAWKALGNPGGEAVAINNIGVVYSELREYPKAIEYIERALPLYRAAGDRQGQAAALTNLGLIWSALGDARKAIERYEQALPLYRAEGDRQGMLLVLNNIGGILNEVGEKRRAMEYYEQALSQCQALKDHRCQATLLLNLGMIWSALGERRKAVEYLEQSLALNRLLKDKSAEATSLNNLGLVEAALGETRKALEHLEQSLALIREVKDQRKEARTLINIAGLLHTLGEQQKELETYEQALSLARSVKDQGAEAAALNGVGAVWNSRGEKQKAFEYLEQALRIFQAVEARNEEAAILKNMGRIQADLEEKGKALEYYERALRLFRAVENLPEEAATLKAIAQIWEGLGEKQKALEYFERAAPVFRKAEDRKNEAEALHGAGITRELLGQPGRAIEDLERALSIYRGLGNKFGEATVLNSVAMVWHGLGETQKAVELLGQARGLFREIKDQNGEAATLHNFALMVSELYTPREAVEFYEQALPLLQAAGNRAGEATTLTGLGLSWSALGEHRKALEYQERSLALRRAVGDKDGEASTLNNIGLAQERIGEPEKALRSYQQTLVLCRMTGNQGKEAVTLNNMMGLFQESSPRLAILFGKQSIARLQQVRSATTRIETDSQRSFLRWNERHYFKLAELLISRGRLQEALQVLNLAKDQEAFDSLFRRDGKNAPAAKQPVLAPYEDAAQRKLQAALERVAAVERQLAELQTRLGTRQPVGEEEARLKQLQRQLEAESAAFQKAFGEIAEEMKNVSAAEEPMANVEDVAELQQTLRELHQRTGTKAAAIFTLLGEKNYYSLLITADSLRVASPAVPVDRTNLEQKARKLLKGLQNPAADPRPLAGEIYHVIFRPVETDVQKSGATLLMWSLDRSLRYLPTAALWDGKQYLIERYQQAVFTRTNRERMLAEVSPMWTGLGFGSSKPQAVNFGDKERRFSALPGVPRELSLVFGSQPQRQPGILAGETLLDERCTKQAFLSALKQSPRRPVVHIASHFSFTPGEDQASFLLLGNGETLTLAEMKQEADLFRGVELLALSACSTGALQANAFGREVDAFAELAQRLGAGAVMASLWEVSDAATPELMEEFYRQKTPTRGLTKAEALRQAQLAMLGGKLHRPDASSRGDSTLAGEIDREFPVFTKDKAKPYAHPYYWAPFILIGNWR